LKGYRILRKSLATRDAAKANARMARLIEICSKALTGESDEPGQKCSSVAVSVSPEPEAATHSARILASISKVHDAPAIIETAVQAFLANCETNGVREPTIRKYRNSLRRLATFMGSKDIHYVRDVTVTLLDSFRASRELAPITSLKELETLRAFFSYCMARDLCKANIALMIKGPKIVSPNDVEPYTPEEVELIIAATQQFGRNAYERKRALAIILTLRFTALRISDVAVLRRDRISKEGGRWVVFIRATKNNKRVYLPIPREMKEALDNVPVPREAMADCPYYFWSGKSTVRSIVTVIGESVGAVFKKSGVKKAHAHRFRHTLATELLAAGASFEEVADVLGDSVDVVKKHYAKWSEARQARVTDLLSRVHGNADWSPDQSFA